MISTQPIVHCTNPDCTNPINPVGKRLCSSCQTPLVHRYLWATGSLAAKIKPGEKVADRYEVITGQIWLDSQPGLLPGIPEELSTEIIPYLQLYQHRLHLPQVYGFVEPFTKTESDILLLENVPIDETGNLYPAITDAWQQATAVRQVNLLWQILQLWTPLSELGVNGSLLLPENLRVQGWCVRLLELEKTRHVASLQQLGECWQPWVATAKTPVALQLQEIVQQMRAGVAPHAIATQLNKLLLSCAAELPLTLEVVGATDMGTELTQNEDSCYPNNFENPDDSLLPQVSIVCDGIGGHEGGEVASQLALQSLKLQIRALLLEVAEQTELVQPDLLQQQLEASLRVVNNLICTSNNEQKREGTQRMGTTVVMAVQIPQNIQTISGKQSKNAHELYLAHVGDSRAYWITRKYCQLLTVDDDVAGREVRFARSLHRKALQRPDATALTHALGTKNGEFLYPLIQRFILEEDGILLLCSDGFSDNDWVEQSWREYGVPVLTGEVSLEDAIQEWIKLANQKNGDDNTSVVLTLCRVSPNYLAPIIKVAPVVEILPAEHTEETESAENSSVLVEIELIKQPAPENPLSVRRMGGQKWWIFIGESLALLIVTASIGLFAWWELNPLAFQQICQKLPQKVQQLCLGTQR